jgi:hypothetical protein
MVRLGSALIGAAAVTDIVSLAAIERAVSSAVPVDAAAAQTNTASNFVRNATAAGRRAPWVRGPLWDLAILQSALWLVPLALLLARSSAALDALYFAITALFWIGHRLASAWLAYATEAYRPLLRAQPVRFLIVPFVVALGCFALLLPPDAALPWTRVQRVIALAIVDYLFNTWHFGAQHFGVLSLYRGRAGLGAGVRRRDRAFALGVGGVLIVVADALAGAIAYPEQWLGPLPALVAAHAQAIRFAAEALLVVATAAMLAADWRRRSLPRLLYILGLGAMVAVALQPRSLFLFLAIWTSQHWILAVGLSARVPGAAPPPQRGPLRCALHALNTRPWALLVVMMSASLLLLPLFEIEANWGTPGATFYGDRIFGAFAIALRSSPWVPALLALGFATGFTHYLLDRAVYRFSDPKVRTAASALLAPSN